MLFIWHCRYSTLLTSGGYSDVHTEHRYRLSIYVHIIQYGVTWGGGGGGGGIMNINDEIKLTKVQDVF